MTEAPTPILPRGAGGPLRRAAGWVSPAAERPGAAGGSAPDPLSAAVAEPDPLIRLLVVGAVRDLGFTVESADAAAGTVFVSLDQPEGCRRVRAAASPPPGAGGSAGSTRCPLLVVGYGAGSLASLAAHRAHACVDLVLALRAAEGRAAFTHLPADDPVRRAGLTAREADVLVLLLAGLTTAAIALRLCVSPATARSHCRAVLRKLGVGDRRMLRARFLDDSPRPVFGVVSAGVSRFA